MKERPLLLLASASPRRLALLRQIGVEPDRVEPAGIDETPQVGELPRDHCARLAEAKARAVFDRQSDLRGTHPVLVLAADTVVACGRRILPKAETEAELRACLSLLSGRRHRVYTALALIDATGALKMRMAETSVRIRQLTQVDIDAYAATGEWKGKAGGYAIQGCAAAFVPWINGSYSNIVGLPLYETANLLTGAGYVLGCPRGETSKR